MKYGSYIIRGVNRAAAAFRAVRWGDPLVQSWGLIGGLLVAGIVLPIAAGRGTGEQKNAVHPPEVTHHIGDPSGWRPAVVVQAPAETLRPVETPAALDLRALASAAAARESWQFALPALRAQLRSLPAAAGQISVAWSHTPGGDARALCLYHRETLGAAETLPFDFVIGNGKRSRDGNIEAAVPLAGAGEWPAGGIRICLAGQPGELTAAQKTALGELINCLEARCGTLALVLHTPVPATPQPPEETAALAVSLP